MLVRPAATAFGSTFCAEVKVTGPIVVVLAKWKLRSEPLPTRVMLGFFLM
jgi:hypothetical protein